MPSTRPSTPRNQTRARRHPSWFPTVRTSVRPSVRRSVTTLEQRKRTLLLSKNVLNLRCVFYLYILLKLTIIRHYPFFVTDKRVFLYPQLRCDASASASSLRVDARGLPYRRCESSPRRRRRLHRRRIARRRLDDAPSVWARHTAGDSQPPVDIRIVNIIERAPSHRTTMGSSDDEDARKRMIMRWRTHTAMTVDDEEEDDREERLDAKARGRR